MREQKQTMYTHTQTNDVGEDMKTPNWKEKCERANQHHGIFENSGASHAPVGPRAMRCVVKTQTIKDQTKT